MVKKRIGRFTTNKTCNRDQYKKGSKCNEKDLKRLDNCLIF